MNQATIKKAKAERTKAEVAAGRGGTVQEKSEKPLFEDEFYVIKVLDVSNLNQKAQFEALNEIATMQSLNSPYIVCYYDSFIDGEEKPKINIVIEYCHNGDLSTFIEKQDKLEKQNKYLNENLVWKLFINLCLGLEHMHSKDIIHRDLKSLNIFLTKD